MPYQHVTLSNSSLCAQKADHVRHGALMVGDGFRARQYAHESGFGVRQRMEGNFTMSVLEHDRGELVQFAAQYQLLLFENPTAKADPLCAVVVACDHDDWYPRANDESRQDIVEQSDGFGRWHRTVIDITGDDDSVDVLRFRQLDELVEHMRLVMEQRGAV